MGFFFRPLLSFSWWPRWSDGRWNHVASLLGSRAVGPLLGTMWLTDIRARWVSSSFSQKLNLSLEKKKEKPSAVKTNHMGFLFHLIRPRRIFSLLALLLVSGHVSPCFISQEHLLWKPVCSWISWKLPSTLPFSHPHSFLYTFISGTEMFCYFSPALSAHPHANKPKMIITGICFQLTGSGIMIWALPLHLTLSDSQSHYHVFFNK